MPKTKKIDVKNWTSWTTEQHKRWEMECYPGFEPRRIICLRQGVKRWAAISTDEASFQEAIADACGLEPASHSNRDWAHGPCMLTAMTSEALLTLTSAPFVSASGTLHASGTDHHFGLSAASNYIRFMFLPLSLDFGLAVNTVASLFKRADLLDSIGFDAPEFKHLHQKQSSLNFGLRYERAHGQTEGFSPDPIVQVDGDGQAHWLWIPAAARCLGAPAELSISQRGIQGLLAFGNITGAANRLASESPAAFRSNFAESLIPIDKPTSLKSHGLAPVGVIEEFILRDMRASIACPEAHSSSINASTLRI